MLLIDLFVSSLIHFLDRFSPLVADRGGAGQITFEELIEILKIPLKGDGPERLGLCFQLHDKDSVSAFIFIL